MTPRWLSRPRARARSEASVAYASATLPRSATPWLQAPWCVLDFELTGLDLDRDEIIAFGAIPIDAGAVRLGGAVSTLVRPEREVGEAAIRIHSIRAVDLAGAPPLDQALEPLLGALAGRGLVVHAAAVERAHLGRALRRRRLRLRGPVIDTEALGRIWLHGRDGRLRRHLGLGELAEALGLPAERPHDALGDALTTAQVFIALAAHLDSEQPETVGTLAAAERRLEAIRMFQGG
jgi:DNA polymerase-3 subunit epsilon